MSEEYEAYGLLMKGRKLLEEGHPHQAVIALEKASLLEPNKMSIREALARALYNSGQTKRAGEEFARLVEAEPANDYGHFGLGLCHLRTGKRSLARGHLKLAVVLRPDYGLYREALDRLTG
jgi:Flp pilus assembly protein TadD